MWWPWRRDPRPGPAVPPSHEDDDASRRLRELAAHWQRDPGVRPWEDLVDPVDRSAPGEALAGPTMLLPTAGPLLTPGQRWRSQGRRS